MYLRTIYTAKTLLDWPYPPYCMSFGTLGGMNQSQANNSFGITTVTKTARVECHLLGLRRPSTSHSQAGRIPVKHLMAHLLPVSAIMSLPNIPITCPRDRGTEEAQNCNPNDKKIHPQTPILFFRLLYSIWENKHWRSCWKKQSCCPGT